MRTFFIILVAIIVIAFLSEKKGMYITTNKNTIDSMEVDEIVNDTIGIDSLILN